MAIELFWGSGSGPAWRALLALTVKKLPFESRLISFSEKQHKSAEILAMNPRGKVPVLRDGDYSVYESLAILTYLERKYPETPLFGTSPEETGTITRVIMEHQCYGEPAIVKITHPLLFNRLDLEREAVEMALPKMHEELGALEAQLRATGWLVGASLSAADLFIFPTWKSIERALGKPGADTLDHGFLPFAEKFPALDAWAKRIEAIPGYDATFPPHWRQG
jgi:glutathione S-transferase